MTLQLVQAAIPYFQKDKIAMYNDLINLYSQQQINNSQTIQACYEKIMAANRQHFDEQPKTQLTSI